MSHKVDRESDPTAGTPPPTAAAVVSVGIQVRCRLDKEYDMFRVLESKGKALSSGGFGVTIPSMTTATATTSTVTLGEEVEAMTTTSTTLTTTTTTSTTEESIDRPIDGNIPSSSSFQYLFIEEVLFLYERGLLECFHEDEEREEDMILQSSQLYAMLPSLQMSLPMYLVYKHLRDQDFRVLRHAPERYSILEQQEILKNMDSPCCPNEFRALRNQVRESVAKASTPTMKQQDWEDDNCSCGCGLSIAWDAYKPCADFAKTHPGFPDFYVTAAFFNNESHVHFSDIEELMKEQCHGIPLKLALVSDSGTVVMFGVTDFGVPAIGGSAEGE